MACDFCNGVADKPPDLDEAWACALLPPMDNALIGVRFSWHYLKDRSLPNFPVRPEPIEGFSRASTGSARTDTT